MHGMKGADVSDTWYVVCATKKVKYIFRHNGVHVMDYLPGSTH